MKNSCLLLLLALLFSFSACQRTWHGEGPVVAQSRNVDAFNRVVLNMNALVLIKDSSGHTCTVNAQQNLQEAIVTRMEGNTLIITSKGKLETEMPVTIDISMNRAMAFEVNGSGKIKALNTLKNEEMDIDISGSGEMLAEIIANKVTSAVSGSGKLHISGTANSFDVEINGSGTVDAFNFYCLNSKARISGSGEANLNVAESIRAKVNGSGIISYMGNPEIIKQVNGSGTVEKVNR
jgi:hypothetical protein